LLNERVLNAPVEQISAIIRNKQSLPNWYDPLIVSSNALHDLAQRSDFALLPYDEGAARLSKLYAA